MLFGLWLFYLVRAELQTAYELGEQLLRLVRSVKDRAFLLEAHRASGVILCYILKDNRFILGTVVAKEFVTYNEQIMTDPVFVRGFIGQFEGILLTTPANTESIGTMVHYTASARYHTGFQRTTCHF